jgi:hypothetical protein
MIELSWLGWIIKPLKWLVQHVWKTMRVKDGSNVLLGGMGDSDQGLPEILFIGLKGTEQSCLLQLPLFVKNDGLAPVRNLAVAILLPKHLASDLPVAPSDPTTSGSFFRTESGRFDLMLNFHLPTLRIDEGIELPITLRLTPRDWTTVRAGGPQRRKAGIVRVDY